MQSTKIKEQEDYAYQSHVGRSAPDIPTSSHGIYRVRVLEKGCTREVLEDGWYRREGARKDGIRVQFLNDDGTLTDRVQVVRSKNIRCPWLTYHIAKREADQRQREECAIRERQEAERKRKSAITRGRLADLGLSVTETYWNRRENDVVQYSHNEWRFTADGINKLLDLIPDHILAARLAEQEIAEQVENIQAELVEA